MSSWQDIATAPKDGTVNPFEMFRVGDHVAHIRIGDGRVTANNGSVIEVTYKSPSRLIGRYDENWFRVNPNFLFHRSQREKAND
jgi:hypothetical protein